MARKFRKKALVYAPESQYGVDAISAGATATPPVSPTAVLGREMTITPIAGENTALDYDDGTLGNSPELATETYVTIEFGVDWAGGGSVTTAPAYAGLLKACLRGLSVQAADADNNIGGHTAFAIAEDSADSVTLYFYLDGTLHALVGARGNMKLEAKAKAFPQLLFSFTGLFVTPSAGAIPTTDFSAWQTPMKVGAAYTSCVLAGQAAKLISFEYDQGNEVKHTEYVGHEEVLITDYQPSGKIVLEAAGLGSFNPFELAIENREVGFALTHGVAGNQVHWQSERLQLGRPEYGEQDGTLTYEIPIRPLGAGDLLVSR
ncbi:phage tail tube protein [Ferrimonas balearica]|uniref:phage tail tube protein n=1 Tax=Ferrimonas balearica TaxID=44012 RepID=UPI001C9682EA|nr:phage tail tube protein [Ferrimonas balearica]MBY6223560.1 hypothetical protein [Ferrimonas balearica]